MATVFLSYAHEDRARAKAIAHALSTRGWTVWWDRTIPPGRTFDEVIEDALEHARCVVVLWSKMSVTSHWVKAEAAEGVRRQILVPALLDDVRIPLEFRRVQAADLSAWNGDQSHAEFERLVQSISTFAPSAVPAAKAVPAAHASPQKVPASPLAFDSFEQATVRGTRLAPRAERRSSHRIRWIIGASAVIVALAGGVYWRDLLLHDVTVPGVGGKAVVDAGSAVTQAGPAVGQIDDRPTDETRPNLVPDQPPPAATVPPNDRGELSDRAGTKARLPDAPASKSRSVEVPPLMGLALAEAQDRLVRRGFSVGQISRQTTDSVDPDTVVAQEPPAGSRPAPGSSVSLVVAQARVAVPRLVGLPLDKAQAALAATGLQLGKLTKKLDESVNVDSVIGQTPLPGTRIESGRAVDLDVGQTAVRVPMIVGQAPQDGSDMLKKAKLQPGRLTKRETTASKPGVILSQSVRSGTLVAIGTPIDFEVASAPAESR